ncbi:MAG: DUF748 domain-containing protein, partial [Burkholderiales bacterium]|nr:DUF748 domain-containing protein [Burkholderiales bacterium]
MPQETQRAHPIRRKFAIAALTVFALWLLSCAIVGLWLPGKLQRVAAEWGRAHGREVVIGTASINPFTWTVTLGNLRLADADKSVLFAAKSLVVEAKPSSLLRGRYRLNRIELDQPTVGLARKQGGDWNWVRFIHDAKDPNKPKSDEPLPKFVIDHIGIAQGHVAVVDGDTENASWLLDPLNLSVNDLSTLPVEGGYHLSVVLDDGARLDWHGNLELEPLSSTGDLALDGLTLARLWPFVPPSYHLAPPKGAIQLKAHYQFADNGAPSVTVAPFSAAVTGIDLAAPGGSSKFALSAIKLDGGEFKLADRSVHVASLDLDGGHVSAARDGEGVIDWLRTLPAAKQEEKPAAPTAKEAAKPAAVPWQLAVDKINFADWQFNFHDASTVRPADISLKLAEAGLAAKQGKGGMVLKDIHAHLADIALADGSHATPIKLASVKLEPTTVDLSEHRVSPGRLDLDGLAVTLTRDRGGKIDLLDLLKPAHPAPAAKAAEEPAKPSPPWQVEPAEIALSNGNMQWHDDAAPKPANIALTDLRLAGKLGKDKDVKARVEGKLASGTLGVDLSYAPDAPATTADVTLNHVPLLPFAPYALGGTTLSMTGGSTSAALRVTLPSKGAWQVSGRAGIAQFAVTEPSQPAPLVGWNALDVTGLQAHGGEQMAVNIDRVRFDTAQLRVKLDKQRNLNLTQLFAKPAPTGKAEAAPKPVEQPAASPKKAGPQVNIRSIVVKTAEVDFADQSLNPGFATRMHDLSGTVQGISTNQTHHATVTLDGQVDSFGIAKVRGTLAPFALTDDSILVLGFQNIPINSLDPYSETFAGWRLEDGRLNVD